jgi:hypothetical protein
MCWQTARGRGDPAGRLVGIVVGVMLVAGACGSDKAAVPTSGVATRSVSIAGVRLAVPHRWFACIAILPQGGTTGFAWLQASNFPAQSRIRGKDPLKAMGPNDVVLTISEGNQAAGSAPRLAGQQIQLTPRDARSLAQTPRGGVDLQIARVIRNRSFTMDADFGSPTGAQRLLPTVNRILALLQIQATRR